MNRIYFCSRPNVEHGFVQRYNCIILYLFVVSIGYTDVCIVSELFKSDDSIYVNSSRYC